jgi:hypothetical protein
MALEMRASCEKCRLPLAAGDLAFICSHECTYCPACAIGLAQRCPNCAGELVRRPRRQEETGA